MNRRPPASRTPAGLTADELAAVVRRATELDVARPDRAPDLALEDARAVLREAGVSPAAASQALEEWQRGEIVATPPPPLQEVGRGLPSLVVVERHVPLAPAAVQAALDGQFRRQTFVRGRQFGAGMAEWIPRAGLYADLRRKLDFRGTLLFEDVSRIRLEVAPARDDESAVRLTADLGVLRSRLMGGMVVAPAAAGVAASIIGIPVESLELVVGGLPIGLALAGGGYLGAGRSLERRRARLDESLHILLDRLVT